MSMFANSFYPSEGIFSSDNVINKHIVDQIKDMIFQQFRNELDRPELFDELIKECEKKGP